jgi:hypothetical protein
VIFTSFTRPLMVILFVLVSSELHAASKSEAIPVKMQMESFMEKIFDT